VVSGGRGGSANFEPADAGVLLSKGVRKKAHSNSWPISETKTGILSQGESSASGRIKNIGEEKKKDL